MSNSPCKFSHSCREKLAPVQSLPQLAFKQAGFHSHLISHLFNSHLVCDAKVSKSCLRPGSSGRMWDCRDGSGRSSAPYTRQPRCAVVALPVFKNILLRAVWYSLLKMKGWVPGTQFHLMDKEVRDSHRGPLQQHFSQPGIHPSGHDPQPAKKV